MTDEKKDGDHLIYQYMKPKAEVIKIVLQMFVGLFIFIFLAMKLLIDAGVEPNLDAIYETLKAAKLLSVVAYGLGVSATIELAYMLFTPGPDEVIDPLLMGLASTVLLLMSKADLLSWQLGLGILFIVAAMAGLFYLRPKVLKT